jgi:hypothetical protein
MKNIPKILHLYWDCTVMTQLQTFTIRSFHSLNPDWKINVYIPSDYTPVKVDFIKDNKGKDHFYLLRKMQYVNIITVNLEDYGINKALHAQNQADLFRYHILYNEGGVWSDFDVLWIRPIWYMDKVFHLGDMEEMTTLVCMYELTEKHHNIGVMMSAKNTDFIKSLIDRSLKIRERLPPDQRNTQLYAIKQLMGTTMMNELYPELKDITKKFDNVVAIKYETFYPYSIFNLRALYMDNDLHYINANVMCIHWFCTHPLSKEYVNNNGYKTNCSMTAILEKCGYI